jgi:hypothetical protein
MKTFSNKAIYQHRPFPVKRHWCLDPIVAARRGLGSEVSSTLIKSTQDWQTYVNGMALTDVGNSEHPEEEFYIEQVGIVADALQEALVHDYDGSIRIAPAIAPGSDSRRRSSFAILGRVGRSMSFPARQAQKYWTVWLDRSSLSKPSLTKTISPRDTVSQPQISFSNPLATRLRLLRRDSGRSLLTSSMQSSRYCTFKIGANRWQFHKVLFSSRKHHRLKNRTDPPIR